jgi:hypothetical protein
MMFTKQDLARGKVIVMAMAFGTLLLLATNQAQAALLFWEDSAEFADKPAGDWADLALPETTSDGAMGSWYGGSFDTQTGLSFGMDDHGLDSGESISLLLQPVGWARGSSRSLRH